MQYDKYSLKNTTFSGVRVFQNSAIVLNIYYKVYHQNLIQISFEPKTLEKDIALQDHNS